MTQSGYSSVSALVVVFILSLGILVLAFFCSALIKYSETYRIHYEKQKIALDVLDRLTESMQLLVNDERDDDYSYNRNIIIELYAGYGLILDDVSSGINVRFLHESIFNSPGVSGLMSFRGEEIEADYGWIPMNFCNQEMLASIQASFNSDDLFPLVNRFPVFNLFYTDSELINELLKTVRIKESESKAVRLNSEVKSGNLSDSEIARILGVKESDKILDLFGVKTSFWRARFQTEDCSVIAVYAAIPDGEESRTVERYVLIEKELTFGER